MFNYTIDADEIAGLEWWRAELSREIERLNSAKKAAERDRNIEAARWWREIIADEQKLLRAINLACDWLIGRDDLIGKPASRVPDELLRELRRVDAVLVYGVSPRNLPYWFEAHGTTPDKRMVAPGDTIAGERMG